MSNTNSDNEELEPTVQLTVELKLLPDEYLCARDLGNAQLLEVVIGEVVRGRKAESIDAFVWGPIECAKSLEIDTNWTCRACGKNLYVLEERVLKTKPSIIVEKICGECGSNRVESREP